MIRLLSSLALGSTAIATMLQAQSPSEPPSPFPAVPTTKVLAIGHISANMTAGGRKRIMPDEVSSTVRLYLSGKIDQWYVRKDRNGVVFLMNVNTVEEAHTLLEALPLGKAKLMEFELIPLGPLSPLNILLQQNRSTGAAPSGSPEK